MPLALFSCIHLFLSEFIFFFLIPTLLSCALSVSDFHLLLPSCCLCFALLCSFHRHAFLFAIYPHHSFSSSYASLLFCLLPPAFDVGLFPLVLILPPKLCQHSHIGRFFGFSCPFSPYSYTKVVTMSLLALMRMNSSERWRWNGRVSFSS